MFTVILLATLAQPQGPSPHPQVGLPPLQGVARLNGRGALAIARVNSVTCSCYGSADREVWLTAPEKKPGEKVMVKAKITRVMVSVVELPAHVVEAYTADGRPIQPAKLADLLAKERTVLLAVDGKKVDPFQLQLYKEDTIVLVPPANLEGLEYGPSITPGLRGPDEPPLKKMPAEKDRPKTDGAKTTSWRVNTFFIAQDDEKEKTPEVPAATGIGGMLRVPDKLPRSAAPTVSTVVLNLGGISLTRQFIVSFTQPSRVTDTVEVQTPFEVNVTVDGRTEKRTVLRTEYRTVEREFHVTISRVELVKQTVPAEKIKAFTVTKAGGLKAISKAALLEMLAKPTAALIGEADLDPRHLELVRPGTLFLAIPPYVNQPAPPPKEPIQPKNLDKDSAQTPEEVPVSVVDGDLKDAPANGSAPGSIDAAMRKRDKLPASYGTAEVVLKESAAQPSMAPVQGLAVISDKGTLTITRLEHGLALPSAGEVWLKVPAKKDSEKVQVKATVTRVQLTVVELPAHVVQAYTVDGKTIEAARLGELLAKERTVLIALDGKKVDPFHLELYKEGTIVLVTPANLWDRGNGMFGLPGPEFRGAGGGYGSPYSAYNYSPPMKGPIQPDKDRKPDKDKE